MTNKTEYTETRCVLLRNFLATATKFDCPYLAVPTKLFEDKYYLYFVFDNQIEDLAEYIASMPVGEFNETLVIKIVTQLIQAMKYLHERNLTALNFTGNLRLCIKRIYNDTVRINHFF